MNTEMRQSRPILLPASEFTNLKIMLEQLTGDKLQVENTFGPKNQRSLGVYSLEGKVRVELRSRFYVSLEEVSYQSLIIAVISFTPERVGIGSKAINWLTCYAIDKGFERICIENANTDASVGFAQYLGFSRVPLNIIMSEIIGISESSDFELKLTRD